MAVLTVHHFLHHSMSSHNMSLKKATKRWVKIKSSIWQAKFQKFFISTWVPNQANLLGTHITCHPPLADPLACSWGHHHLHTFKSLPEIVVIFHLEFPLQWGMYPPFIVLAEGYWAGSLGGLLPRTYTGAHWPIFLMFATHEAAANAARIPEQHYCTLALPTTDVHRRACAICLWLIQVDHHQSRHHDSADPSLPEFTSQFARRCQFDSCTAVARFHG